MKNKKIFNITLLSSLLLLSACSTKQAKPMEKSANEKVSIYNLMGITKQNSRIIEQAITPVPQRQIQAPVQPYFPIVKTNNLSNDRLPMISPNITYISYKKSPPMDYLSQKRQELLDNIELDAKRFLGVPYVWGATGPNKFDCSGFTQWVYRDSGINIPRISRDQARVGQFVQYEDLQRGDMVFFDTKKKRQGKVTHVGIYLGHGDFIHASSAGKSVVIYNFNQKPYYKDRFLWGRRVLNPELYYASN